MHVAVEEADELGELVVARQAVVLVQKDRVLVGFKEAEYDTLKK